LVDEVQVVGARARPFVFQNLNMMDMTSVQVFNLAVLIQSETVIIFLVTILAHLLIGRQLVLRTLVQFRNVSKLTQIQFSLFALSEIAKTVFDTGAPQWSLFVEGFLSTWLLLHSEVLGMINKFIFDIPFIEHIASVWNAAITIRSHTIGHYSLETFASLQGLAEAERLLVGQFERHRPFLRRLRLGELDIFLIEKAIKACPHHLSLVNPWSRLVLILNVKS